MNGWKSPNATKRPRKRAKVTEKMAIIVMKRFCGARSEKSTAVYIVYSLFAVKGSQLINMVFSTYYVYV